MANPNWHGYTTTALAFSDDSEVERNCKKILQAFDKGKKHMLTVLCSLSYPEYFEKGNTIEDCPKLKAKVEQFYKKYSSNIVEDVVFLGWDKKYTEQDKMFTLLNIHLAGGAKDFIIDLLVSHFVLLSDNAEIRTFNKEVHPSSSHKRKEEIDAPVSIVNKEETPSVSSPASAPAPVLSEPVQAAQEDDVDEDALLDILEEDAQNMGNPKAKPVNPDNPYGFI